MKPKGKNRYKLKSPLGPYGLNGLLCVMDFSLIPPIGFLSDAKNIIMLKMVLILIIYTVKKSGSYAGEGKETGN